MENPTTSATAPAEPQKSKKSKKLIKLIEILLAIPGGWPAYQGINKLADSEREKYIVLAKRILKPATATSKIESVNEIKLIDFAFIGGVPFTYLAKQKNIEICMISIQNIEYQLKKATKTSADPKTMVPEEYHKFLDVFSKEALDTLSEHSKYDHRIQFLKGYKNHSNSPLQAMSELKL